jgi:hypothetical protein
MLEKPLRGAYTLERKRKAREHKAREADIMRQVKAEDGHKCRVPRCADQPVGVAHEDHRGMGGNPAEHKTVPSKLITLCTRHHSMWDRALMDIVPVTDRRLRGACEFYIDGVFVARERIERVSVERSIR